MSCEPNPEVPIDAIDDAHVVRRQAARSSTASAVEATAPVRADEKRIDRGRTAQVLGSGDFHDEDERPDAARLRRDFERWDGLERATRLGEITMLRHGGRSRPVIHRGSRHLRSRIVSRKTGRLQLTEGKGLRFLCVLCETGAWCLDYQAHPMIVRTVADGVRWKWYPDLVRSVVGGPIELIEVKRTVRDLDDPLLERKYEIMAELARRVGWRFRILYDRDIFGAEDVAHERAVNAGDVHGARFLRLNRREKSAIDAIVARGGASWAEARSLVAPTDRLRGDEVLLCAAARGKLLFDFDEVRTDRTRLSTIVGSAPTIRI
ncbi:hypothetical protein [Sphingomonas panni]|uniref:hypothetical protein n=1 Tax=Sphingomonas panni TaxID=237612 RepID=UPI001F5BE435|nr:hypothetical protein [Sphingomonas panni]